MACVCDHGCTGDVWLKIASSPFFGISHYKLFTEDKVVVKIVRITIDCRLIEDDVFKLLGPLL